MNPFLVVPTLGNRDSLWPLLRDADMPAVVVWTNPTENPPSRPTRSSWQTSGHSVDFIIDRGPINIHRWWRKGADVTASQNGGPVVICNDDVEAAPGALRKLAESVAGDVVLSYLDRPEHAATRVTAITGWCFAMDPWRLPIVDGENDDGLRWWYGDHDLELRALEMYPRGERVTRVAGLDIEHLRTDWRYDRPDEISPLIPDDRRIFNHRWGWKVGAQ